MSSVNITVESAGLLTLVVDAGRQLSAQEQGFCVSGAVDIRTYNLVNWLCANQQHAATFECIGELVFTVDAPLSVAVGGPHVDVLINQQPAPAWQTLHLKAGDELRCGSARTGSKCYVAVTGQWQLPRTQASQSIVMREGVGGLHNDGTPVKAGQVYDIKARSMSETREVTAPYIPDYSLGTPLDVVTGYQYHAFAPWQRQLFFASEYTVSNQIDRMGYRLSGQPISCEMRTMRSEGINFGAIQLPPDGQPIVMFSDRQTLGGYPKIGCVAEYDIYRLAQAVPGDTVTFRAVDIDNARAGWLLRDRLERQLFEQFESEEV